nr:pri [Herpesvirus DDDp]
MALWRSDCGGEVADDLPVVAGAGCLPDLKYIFLNKGLIVSAVSHDEFCQGDELVVLAAGHLLGTVADLQIEGRVLRDCRVTLDNRSIDAISTKDIAWSVFDRSAVDASICPLPEFRPVYLNGQKQKVYVTKILMGDTKTREDLLGERRHARVYEAETAFYNWLGERNVDPCFHNHVWFATVSGAEPLPVDNPASVDPARVFAAVTELELKLGVSLTRSAPGAVKCTRVLAIRCSGCESPAAAAKPSEAAAVLGGREASFVGADACSVTATPNAIGKVSGDTPGVGGGHQQGLRDNLACLIAAINRRLHVPPVTEEPSRCLDFSMRAVTFKAMIAFCTDPEWTQKRPFPPRSWQPATTVPYVLLDDGELGMAGGAGARYKVTWPEQLKNMSPGSYSEVFLKRQAITVVNVDIDREFEFDTESTVIERAVEAFVTGGLAEEFIKTVAVAGGVHLENETGVKNLTAGTSLLQWGSVAAYMRQQALPDKLSCRLVWYPPLEMCFVDMDQLRRFWTVFRAHCSAELANVIDFAPFAYHKSCRLPCAKKVHRGVYKGRFEFMGVVNSMIASSEFEAKYNNMYAGISRQPVGYTRPLLSDACVSAVLATVWADGGDRPRPDDAARHFPNVGDFGEDAVVSAAAVTKARALLETWWGVGNVYFVAGDDRRLRAVPVNRAAAKCAIHDRTHRNAAFSVTVVSRGYLFPQCFSNKGTPPLTPGQYFSLEANGLRIRAKGSGAVVVTGSCPALAPSIRSSRQQPQ